MDTVTVVIPTLNRSETLPTTLQSCVNQEDENFRIVVSDNHSDGDEIRVIVEDFAARDSRVIYRKPDRRMGMSRHWDFALGLAETGWVMLLGSDDVLLPGAIGRLRCFMEKYPGRKIIYSGIGSYFYPEFDEARSNQLLLQIDAKEEIRSSRDYLDRVASFRCNYQQLPIPYQHAFVRTELLDEIQSIAGSRVQSACPDISLGLALASRVDDWVYVGRCFALACASPSGTGMSIGDPSSDRKAEKAWLEENEHAFDPSFGYSRSIYLLIGEAIEKARQSGLLDDDFEIKKETMIARAYFQFRNPRWPKENLEQLREVAINLGLTQLFEDLEASASLDDWAEKSGIDVTWDSSDWNWDLVIRLSDHGGWGPLDAAALAERAYRLSLTVERPEDGESFSRKETSLDALLIALLVESTRENRERLRSRSRVIQETREKLAAAREKTENLKEKNVKLREKLDAEKGASKKTRRHKLAKRIRDLFKA